MKVQYFISVILCCFVLSSCEKNEILFEEMGDGTLLKKVLIEGEAHYEYTYNNAGLVFEEKSKFHYSNHVYNSRNQLIQSNHYWDERIVSSSSHVLDEAMQRTEWVSPENSERDTYKALKYDNSGRLEKITTHRLNTDYESYSSYAYNELGRIERRTSYHENKISVFDNYFYDANGNLTKTDRYFVNENGTEELQTRTDYKFDAKKNPYISFRGLMIPGQNTNRNNIIQKRYERFFEVSGFDEKVSVTNDSYAYNENGYPIIKNGNLELVYY